jgi:hypothetical protein
MCCACPDPAAAADKNLPGKIIAIKEIMSIFNFRLFASYFKMYILLLILNLCKTFPAIVLKNIVLMMPAGKLMNPDYNLCL